MLENRHPKRLWPWYCWLAAFYVCWLVLVSRDGAFSSALMHWPIAVAMALGSYAAGSTPMGGGTVGFPVLVLLFDQPATLGRDFSFAVQSIGMVSASIFILARRQPVAWSMLKGSMIGSVVGLPIGILLVAPMIPDIWIKLVFAVLWGSFGLLHLYRIGEISSHSGMTEFDEQWDLRVGFMLGLLASSLFVSVTGVGIDMLIYAALVLLCRSDLKIAIPTSVIVMAFNSLVGVVIKSATHTWQPGVYENWLAAAPVVALGAPLGVFIVEFIGRKSTLLVVGGLCIAQLVWTCYRESAYLGPVGLWITAVAVLACLMVLEWLRFLGMRLVDKNRQRLELVRKHRLAHAPHGS